MALPIDPVCGMEIVDEHAAPQSIYEGDTRYFCGEGCKTKFDESPERYAGAESRALDPNAVQTGEACDHERPSGLRA